ncbi:MAG: DNA polymerase I [Clostridia bacterium]|nr:DNA polymerase I [Clostridia bacterium]
MLYTWSHEVIKVIGERLAEVRKDHGDTQQDLADKLNVTKFTISNWEQEKSVPSHELLVKVCQLYGVSADCDDDTEAIAKSAMALPALFKKLGNEISEKGMEKLFYDIEIPLALVLADMENLGFLVDRFGIMAFGEELSEKITALEDEIYDLAGEKFNINSPKQLGVILFEKLKLPSGKKTKTGYSTNAEVLERLCDVSPVVAKVLEYRTLAKLKSTYCDGLIKEIAPDGRIHSSFNQTETRTGRISSTEPNLQNIPVRTELGSRMRKFFTAKEGCVLCDADYSQIELRVLAHMADDKVMTQAFNNGDDIHTITASQVFGVPAGEVTPQMRSRAKAVNFGIVYGIGAFSLAKDINVSNAEASHYIKSYLTHYSGVNSYMERTVAQAKDRGYAETLYARRRYLPELSSSNHNLRAFGERVARNMPIQGTAADIIKIAMIRVYRRLAQEKLSAKLILQVHDELIVESPLNEQEKVEKILGEEMSRAADLRVPLPADISSGKTWFDAK